MFQTSVDISRYKECYFPNALRPRSFSYLDLYCDLVLECLDYFFSSPIRNVDVLLEKEKCSLALSFLVAFFFSFITTPAQPHTTDFAVLTAFFILDYQ